jgi:hypothetical protein
MKTTSKSIATLNNQSRIVTTYSSTQRKNFMKRTVLLLVVFAVTLVNVKGQGMPSKSKAILKDFEVPAAVRSSFDRDFGSPDSQGVWTVYFTAKTQGGKTVAMPIWYTFTGKKSGERYEIRYLPDGKLKSSKGLAKKTGDGEPAQDAVEEKPASTR